MSMLIVLYFTEKSAKMSTNNTWDDLKLPPHIRPIAYDITLHPNLTTNEYRGSVLITINVTKASKEIIVHIKKLNISVNILRRSAMAPFNQEGNFLNTVEHIEKFL